MIDRRSFLTSAAPLLAMPGALMLASPALGTHAVHSAADFRKAFDEYIVAYRGFYPMPDGPDRGARIEAHRVYEKEMDSLCTAWGNARRRLLEMVLNNHGSTADEWESNVAGAAVDIGDLVFVASPDPDEEGCYSDVRLVIVPRSPEMTALLDGLYVHPPLEPPPSSPRDATAADAYSSRPLAVDIAVRQALESYIAAYMAFFGKPYDEPEFETTEENNAHWTERADACKAWREARRAITIMVLEGNGLDPYGDVPATVAAASIDLGDIIIAVGGDPDYEGAVSCRTGLYLIGKTPATRARLAALPVWEGDDDTGLRTVRWYQAFLRPRPEFIDENDACVMTDE